MKISPDKSRIAIAAHYSFVEVLNFNAATGAISGTPIVYQATNTSIFKGKFLYGLEFSPNSQQLYVTSLGSSSFAVGDSELLLLNNVATQGFCTGQKHC